MSKKTRAQKLKAVERRREQLLSQLSNPRSTPIVVKKKIQLTKNNATAQPLPEHDHIKKYFLTDFKKSVLIVFLIIGLEIAVYYGTINTYLASVFKF